MTRKNAKKRSENYPSFLEEMGRMVAHNLTLLLAIGFLAGTAMVLDRIADMMNSAEPGIADREIPTSRVDPSVDSATEAKESPADGNEIREVTAERIQHYYRCTFTEYREANYDACVKGYSGIYKPSDNEPDDGSAV